MESITKIIFQIWICPVCGAGISPFVDKCSCITIEPKFPEPNIQISKYGPSVANNDPKIQHPTMVGVKISINKFKDCKNDEESKEKT